MGRRSLSPGAALSLARHPDTEFCCSAMTARSSRRCSTRIHELKAASRAGPHRRRDPHGRQAEPGAAPRPLEIVDVAGDRGGEEGRGRRRGLRRQYRRADGDGASSICSTHGRHRAAGDRRALADAAGRIASCSTSAPRSAPTPSTWSTRRHGRRHGARPVRYRAADRRPAQYRRRGDQGPGGGARGRPHPARAQSARPRLSSASSRATISARARSTSS